MTGKELRRFRKFANLTQTALAARIGVSKITIQRNESAEQVSENVGERMMASFPNVTRVSFALSRIDK